jgi:cysteine desulfurase/selenocysteine lyase
MNDRVRKDFTVLQQKKPPVYFDNACVTLKPRQVTDAIMQYYNKFPACGQRSSHSFGNRVTEEVENSRKIVKKFISAKKQEEIVFTRNTTEAINVISNGLKIKGGILISDKEHNSNLLPWQVHKNKHSIFSTKDFDIQKFSDNWKKGTSLLATFGTSNLDGQTLPIKEMTKIAHDNNALVLVDGAQHAPHHEVNVKKLGVDFLAFSGHKIFGPSGTGVLYAKKEHLEKLNPLLVGGDTVYDTTYNDKKWEELPHKFEAGLQNYAGIIGLGAAIKYAEKIGINNILKHISKLNKQLSEGLSEVNILGSKSGITSFIPKMDVHETAFMLDQQNIMVRSGAHCVHSWFNANKLNGSVRTSLYAYNTEEEVEYFLKKFREVQGIK